MLRGTLLGVALRNPRMRVFRFSWTAGAALMRVSRLPFRHKRFLPTADHPLVPALLGTKNRRITQGGARRGSHGSPAYAWGRCVTRFRAAGGRDDQGFAGRRLGGRCLGGRAGTGVMQWDVCLGRLPWNMATVAAPLSLAQHGSYQVPSLTELIDLS